MREYTSDRIRNVAVVGHGASGKTSLVDALAFVAGSSKRHGSVKDGTSLTDYTPDEIERKYSINLALAHAEWMDTKINLLDAPGYLDFIGDAVAALHAADGVLIVVGATAGVEVGTELMWEHAERRGIPRMFFVSMMDKEHADFEKAYTDIREHLTPKVIPIEIPVGEGAQFHGIVNLFSKRCHLYKAGTKAGEYDETDIPPEYMERFERYSHELIERIAETDDTLLERYLGGEEISREEALEAMKAGMRRGELFPLLCGAADLTYGTRALLSKLVELMPAPADLPPVEAEKWGTPEPVKIPRTDAGTFVGHVFKTVSEPHVGDVTFFRILWTGSRSWADDAVNEVGRRTASRPAAVLRTNGGPMHRNAQALPRDRPGVRGILPGANWRAMPSATLFAGSLRPGFQPDRAFGVRHAAVHRVRDLDRDPILPLVVRCREQQEIRRHGTAQHPLHIPLDGLIVGAA